MINREIHKGFFELKEKIEIDRDQLTNLLKGLFKNITLNELSSIIVNKYTACIEYGKLINGERINTQMSLLFNPHRLDTPTGKDKRTIFNSLTQQNIISGIARVGLVKGIDSKRGLLNIIELGFNGITYIQDFLPYVARDLCKRYNVISTSKILDPCAGWGGRMIGTSVVCNNYEAFEPSTKTYEGLLKLFEFIHSMNPEFNAIVHCLPFEDSKLKKDSFDFALTSPPYYDTERYSDEETNSLNRYKNFDEWCNGFYFPLIKKTMYYLKPNGTFILNIGNRKYPLTEIMMNAFKNKYKITELNERYISNTASFGKGKNKGETFYELKHIN